MLLSLPAHSEKEADERRNGAPVPSKGKTDRRELASLTPPGAVGQAAGAAAMGEAAVRTAAEEGAPLGQRCPRSERVQARSGTSKSTEVLQQAPHSWTTGEAAAAAAAWLWVPGASYILQ